MLVFLKCEKCGWTTFCLRSQARENMRCGAVVRYVITDSPDVGNDGPVQSLGAKPLGCGGKVVEISQEEAMENGRN